MNSDQSNVPNDNDPLREKRKPAEEGETSRPKSEAPKNPHNESELEALKLPDQSHFISVPRNIRDKNQHDQFLECYFRTLAILSIGDNWSDRLPEFSSTVQELRRPDRDNSTAAIFSQHLLLHQRFKEYVHLCSNDSPELKVAGMRFFAPRTIVDSKGIRNYTTLVRAYNNLGETLVFFDEIGYRPPAGEMYMAIVLRDDLDRLFEYQIFYSREAFYSEIAVLTSDLSAYHSNNGPPSYLLRKIRGEIATFLNAVTTNDARWKGEDPDKALELNRYTGDDIDLFEISHTAEYQPGSNETDPMNNPWHIFTLRTLQGNFEVRFLWSKTDNWPIVQTMKT